MSTHHNTLQIEIPHYF